MVSFDVEWNNLRRVLTEFAETFIQLAKDNLGRNRSYASGTLANSMRPDIRIDTNRYSVWISIESYWDYVENGRKPGKFPPPNRIKEWIRVKPIKPRRDKNGRLPTTDQLAYLIGRKIATKGIPARPFFRPAQEEAIARFQDAIDYAIDEDIAEFVATKVLEGEVYNQLFKFL